MAGNKYLSIDTNGNIAELVSTQTSAGSGDAGKIAALNANGQIDSSMLSPYLPKYTLNAKSASFTANDTSGTFYLITASAVLAVTLPASPADGTVYKFKRVSGSGVITFTANGSETIDNAGMSIGSTLTFDNGGTIELIAITGGWQVT